VNGVVLERGHRPVAAAAANVDDEIAIELAAIGRVHHLGVELHRIELTLLIGDGRKGCPVRCADDTEAGRYRHHLVAMAHPHLVALALLPHALEQRIVALDFEEGAAEFAVIGVFHLAAELRAHGLLAIADAENGKAELEDFIRRPGA
jgi:hypothetical protein